MEATGIEIIKPYVDFFCRVCRVNKLVDAVRKGTEG